MPADLPPAIAWPALAAAIRSKQGDQPLLAVQYATGLSHARMHAAAHGKPLGVVPFMRVCAWLGRDPRDFWAAPPNALKPNNK